MRQKRLGDGSPSALARCQTAFAPRGLFGKRTLSWKESDESSFAAEFRNAISWAGAEKKKRQDRGSEIACVSPLCTFRSDPFSNRLPVFTASGGGLFPSSNRVLATVGRSHWAA